MRLVLLGFFLGLSGLLLGGCTPQPPISVNVQLLDPTQLQQIRFLDMALFKKSVTCAQIDQSNYSSSAEPFNSGRVLNKELGQSVVGLEIKEGELKTDRIEKWVYFLGDDTTPSSEGTELSLYLIALAVTGTQKKAIAQGCTTIKLVRGQVLEINITLAPIE